MFRHQIIYNFEIENSLYLTAQNGRQWKQPILIHNPTTHFYIYTIKENNYEPFNKTNQLIYYQPIV